MRSHHARGVEQLVVGDQLVRQAELVRLRSRQVAPGGEQGVRALIAEAAREQPAVADLR